MTTLPHPLIITARRLPGVVITDTFDEFCTLSIEFSPEPPSDPGRVRYRVYLDTPEFEYEDDSLQSWCGGGTLRDGVESYLSFLSAAAEAMSYPDSDNRDLFPKHIMQWAADHESDIESAQCEFIGEDE